MNLRLRQGPVIRKKLLNILLPLLMLTQTGCVYVVVGGLGALGGYIASPDTVEGISDMSQGEVWDASIEIVSIMGVIEEQNEAAGIILARINNAKVTINVLPMGSSSVKMSVKARKAFFPRISVAQDVYIKIMSSLEEDF